jgi:biopolymer transport protein ExbD
MAFSASNSSQQSEINVTPLIDVLLVLLIIFMVIVPVRPRGLESSVPRDSKSPAPVLGPVSLRVLLGDDAGPGGGRITYEVEGRVVDRAQLSEALSASLRVRAERSVYVSASPRLSYREVAAAVGAAKAAGAITIGLGRL